MKSKKKNIVYKSAQDLTISINLEESVNHTMEPSVLAELNLIKACAAGDIKGQEILYKRFASKMTAICNRYIKNYDTARDVMHDGFIKVFLNIKNFRFESSLETWVTRIMINTTITHLKKEINRQTAADFIENDIPDEHEGEENLPETIEPEKLLELMHEMPVGYRTVLNLYAFENFSHKEIAEKLNISESTSKSQLFKARKMLKKLVNKNKNT